MNASNPYSPPAANVNAPPDYSAARADGVIPEDIYQSMRATKPWATLMGVLGFIAVGLMGLFGLGMMVMGGIGDKLPAWMGIVYLGFAAFYLFPSLFLYRYGASIGVFLQRANHETLGEALRHQKSFWRFVGILTAVVLVVYAAVLVIALVGGIGAAMFLRH